MRRRILFLVPTLAGGGAERVIVTLLRHLDRERFAPMLAVVSMANAVYREEIPADVPVIDLGGARVRSSLARIIRLAWRLRPDVMFSTVGHLNLALAIIRPLLPPNVRTVGREASIVTENLWDERFRSLWLWGYARFYPRFDALVCQSESMRADLVGRLGFPLRKTVLIHNPLEAERIGALASAFVPPGPRRTLELVAAGRLTFEKGFDLAIDAIARLASIDCRLTILGEGGDRAKLEAMIAARGLAGRVELAGFRKNPYPYFAHADAFLLSSRYEAFPNVVLEALACGTPVIAVPAPGGIAEIAAIAGGVRLCRAVDAAAIAAEIGRFAEARARGAHASQTPPISLGAFRPARIVAAYQEVFA